MVGGSVCESRPQRGGFWSPQRLARAGRSRGAIAAIVSAIAVANRATRRFADPVERARFIAILLGIRWPPPPGLDPVPSTTASGSGADFLTRMVEPSRRKSG